MVKVVTAEKGGSSSLDYATSCIKIMCSGILILIGGKATGPVHIITPASFLVLIFHILLKMKRVGITDKLKLRMCSLSNDVT